MEADYAAAAAAAAAAAGVPLLNISVDISLPLPEMTPSIVELCKDIFVEWSNIDYSCFSLEAVSGGITNLLLKVSVRKGDGTVDSVTVRLYGPNTDMIIDRQRELKALPYLSAAGFGAKLLGIFKNGVVQSYIDARTLSPQDLGRPQIAAEIARELRRFHLVYVPGSKEPQLWIDIYKFLREASALCFDNLEKQRRYEEISFDGISKEINELKELTDLLHAPVVFAHNDLLSGNLMRNDQENKLYFIDFEYGSYSYRGYDIANHFNEYAGFDCDYSLYPNKDAQFHFFKNYLKPNSNDEAKVSPIDFDYLGYFFLRYNEFRRQKDECLSELRSYLRGQNNGLHLLQQCWQTVVCLCSMFVSC